MVVLAIVADLMFRSKIETAAADGVTVRVVTQADAALAALREGSCDHIVFDLDGMPEPVALVMLLRAAAPATPIIGFCSHVEIALQRDALAAGCTQVLPRSAFVQRLPALLSGK